MENRNTKDTQKGVIRLLVEQLGKRNSKTDRTTWFPIYKIHRSEKSMIPKLVRERSMGKKSKTINHMPMLSVPSHHTDDECVYILNVEQHQDPLKKFRGLNSPPQ